MTQRRTGIGLWMKRSLSLRSHNPASIYEDAFSMHSDEGKIESISSPKNPGQNLSSGGESGRIPALEKQKCNNCETIDDAMMGLHYHPDNASFDDEEFIHEYDWILDGDMNVSNLDDTLLKMELEQEKDAPDSSEAEEELEWGEFVSAPPLEAFQIVPEGMARQEFLDCNSSQASMTSNRLGCTSPSELTSDSSSVSVDTDVTDTSSTNNDEHSKSVLYSLLPLPSPSTAEGRFFRRRMKGYSLPPSNTEQSEWWQKSDLEMEANLSSKYYTKEYDPIPDILKSIPEDMEEYLTRVLSELDVTKSQIEQRLKDRVVTKYQDILGGIKECHNLDIDLAHAHLFSRRGAQHLVAARHENTTQLQFLDYIAQRKFLYELEEKCEKLTVIFAKDFLSVEHMEYGKVQSLLDEVDELKGMVDSEKDLMTVKALDGVRLRVVSMVGRFCREVEGVWISYISGCCLFQGTRKWSEEDYESIVKARLVLQPALILENNNSTPSSTPQTITSSILHTLLLEIERALCSSILASICPSLLNLEHVIMQIEKATDETELRNISTYLLHLHEGEIFFKKFELMFQNACLYFSDILYLHHLLVNFHQGPIIDSEYTHDEISPQCSQDPPESFLGEFLIAIKSQRRTVLDRSITLITFLMEHFMHQVHKHKSQKLKLETLKNICDMSELFLKIGKEFLGEGEELDGVERILVGKIKEILKKYLRNVHVEAMNVVGGMLAGETWDIFPLMLEESAEEDSIQRGLEKLLLERFPSNESLCKKSVKKKSSNSLKTSILNDFHSLGNPFLVSEEGHPLNRWKGEHTQQLSITDISALTRLNHITNENAEKLYSSMKPFVYKEELNLPTQSTINGLAKWTSQILFTLQQFPLLSESVNEILQNVYDLYFLTIFRLCAASASGERSLLGEDERQGLAEDIILSPPRKRNGARRQNIRKRTGTHVFTSSMETFADICAPSPNESDDVAASRSFIRRGQASLSGIVHLDKIESWISDVVEKDFGSQDGMEQVSSVLEKRASAALSCLFAAGLLHSATSLVLTLNRRSPSMLTQLCPEEDDVPGIIDLKAYTSSVTRMAPTLSRLCQRMNGVRAIRGDNIVQEILNSGDWEKNILRAHANGYVDTLCDRCVALHKCLSGSSITRTIFPPPLLSTVWNSIIDAAYMSMLTGFSNIFLCSTEGRALMSIDLQVFARCDAVKEAEGNQMMALVNMYVKVFYYDEKGVWKWIEENWRDYRLNAMLGLLACAVGGRDSHGNGDAESFLVRVKDLYKTNSST